MNQQLHSIPWMDKYWVLYSIMFDFQHKSNAEEQFGK